MEKKIKILTVDNLREGMITASKVEENGSLFINSNVVITKTIINRLKSMYFFGNVEVYDNDEEEQTIKSKDISNNMEKDILNRNEEYAISRQTKADDSEDKTEISTFTQKENRLEDTYDIKYRNVEVSFNNMSSELKDIFERIVKTNGKIGLLDIKKLEEFAKKIKGELKSTSTIIKNIVLKGSGTDCIYRHSVNVAALTALLGTWIGLEEYKMNSLIYTAILHDCGKVMVSKEILNKEEKLSNEEFIMIKKHTNYGYNLVKNIAGLDKHISYGVLMHHERLDGSGYPLGVEGREIHPFAKMIAITDIFDAINSNRIYKNKKLPFEAMQIVKDESIKRIDADYSRIFLEHISNYYMGEEAILSNGERCKIIGVDIDDLQNPTIFKNGRFINLSKIPNLYIKEIV